MLTGRKANILSLLMAAEKPLTSECLASTNQVTSRTVRNDIKELNQFLSDYGAEIEPVMSKGFQLRVVDEQLFRPLMREISGGGSATENNMPTLPEERIRYLVNRFLLADGYIKLEEVADELFISESTVKNDLREVKKIFARYGIKMDNRPNFGMKIKAEEDKLRFCMSEYVFIRGNSELETLNSHITILPSDEMAAIQRITLEQIKKHHITFSDIAVKNLLIHIAIACKRIRSENYVSIYPDDLQSITSQYEYEVALQMVDQLESTLDIVFPEIETAYLAIHLLGAKILIDQQVTDKEAKSIIDSKTYQLVVNILQGIESKLNLGVFGDRELMLNMCLHLKTAINRYRFGMNMRNPLLDEIRTRYPLAFEAGIIAAVVIEQELGTEIDDNEVGYLAMHIGAAIERRKIGDQKKRCLIVCASGAGSAQLLYYNLQAKFGFNLEIVGTTEYYRLNQTNFDNLDFIVSTIPVAESLPVPVIEVSTFLGENDIDKVAHTLASPTISRLEYTNEKLVFLQQRFTTKEEVLHFLGAKIQELGLADESFIDSVFNREALSSTAFGNLVAIPHPGWPQTDSTFWAICTLEKPIKWADKKVQFVCLLGVMKQNQEDLKRMYGILGAIINNTAIVQQLLKCKTYKEFSDIIARING